MTALPATMSAIVIDGKGGPDVLVMKEMAVPRPSSGQILVKVAAAGVNRPDVQQRMGAYPPPPGHSPLPGLEIAGEVAAVGANVARWRAGDKVCALVNGGGYAPYCIAEDVQALPIPSGFTLVEAAGLPETVFTVWNNVFERGRLGPGEWFLVHGGTSGIGTCAIQMAKGFGARVIATAGSAEKVACCMRLGADVGIDYRTQDFVKEVKAATGGRGVDVILDMVGGEYTERNIVAAAEDGRIVQIAALGGAEAKINVARLMMKRVTLTGSTLRPRARLVKAGWAREIEERVWPLAEAGRLKVVVDSTLPLAKAADAHRRMETSAHIGKIVLVV
ncbi:MAG: NAD(P)H-quinone oxidoreductase [Hyphomicrobiaceae bacterium]